jgi:hypothetical protein
MSIEIRDLIPLEVLEKLDPEVVNLITGGTGVGVLHGSGLSADSLLAPFSFDLEPPTEPLRPDGNITPPHTSGQL